VLASIVAVVILGDPDEITVAQAWGIVVPVQVAGTFAVLALLARRRPPWRRALAVGFRPIDLIGIPIGFGVQLGFGLIVLVIVDVLEFDPPTQGIVEEAVGAIGGLERLLVFIGAVVLAPVVEEVLFRGILLRALLPRGRAFAIGVSGAVFGLVHLLDPQAWFAVPFLAALGVVLGYQTVRTGRIGMAIMTHGAFNLVTVLVVVFG
jgi:membrane protease YdiL (CAAX protease family)